MNALLRKKHYVEPDSYHRGRLAREEGRAKIAPATCKNTDYWWWLAGWNDRDMELESVK